MNKALAIVSLSVWTLSATAAETPQRLRDGYARAAGLAPAELSVTEGEAMYRRDGGRGRQCASCHTENPRRQGRTRAGKLIEPLAPSGNAARFTDAAKVEKWFGRNCSDVLGRACSAQEKANLIAWLMSIN
ncbi:MAG: DUF1924 domain-containing protein [Rhodocyclaceae bacterium]|nr:DUF1924 domain-containing protein [Rhodocyclaceae bacterium]